MSDAEKIIDLIRHGESLKSINRSGWILAGVKSKRVESVGEHSYGCALTAIIIAQHLKSDRVVIDLGKVALLAILHDLPESITGDIARTREFANNEEQIREKELAERSAIDSIFEPMGKSFKNLHRLWNEFNNLESIEAIVVKAADIIDMLIHARHLEESGTSPEMLHQFFENSRSIIETIDLEIVTEIYNKLLSEHDGVMKTQM